MGGTTRTPKSLTPLRPAVAAQEQSGRIWYHGTSAELKPGDMAEGGHPSNFDKPKGRLDHAYATPHVSTAAGYAEIAANKRGGRPRVYEVDRAHDMMPDPETGAAFGIDSQTIAHPDWRSKAGFRVMRELHPSEFEHHLIDDWPELHGHTAARWQPSAGIFGPTTGLDPLLFDEQGRLRPQVRAALLERMDQCVRVNYQVAGSDWEEWLHLWLAGGSASEWSGGRPNEPGRDLDVLVGLDLATAQGYSSFGGMTQAEAAAKLNEAFRRFFNEQGTALPGVEGTWDLTAYCNPAVTSDIAVIRPYAAYDLTDGHWAVKPPHLPAHTLADFDPAVIAQARAVAAEARAVLKLPEPARTREATALWERVHAGRSAAFSDQGEGWSDPGNVTEKWLAYAPRHLLDNIKELALAPKTAAWDSSGSDHSGVYLRFGDWPHDERSYSPAGGYHEEGVSVYDMDREGEPSIDHGLDRGHPEHYDDCDVDEDGNCQYKDPWGEPDNDPREEMQGRKTRAEKGRYYGSDRPDSVGHLVRGEVSGVGYDGEPLLKNVRRVGDWIDHRHLFVDTAGAHRLARHPMDEDYEEPEEKPPYGYRNEHTAAVAVTASTDELPEEQPGLYWRAHVRSLPFDAEHAYSSPVGPGYDSKPPADVRRGYSAFSHPYHLAQYMPEFFGEDSNHRNVIAFHGRQVGTGTDGEPLVVPHADPSCCGRVVHDEMPWHEFERRAWDTGHIPEHIEPGPWESRPWLHEASWDDDDEDEDPDRYVDCEQGHEHWGALGAAGLLVRHDGKYLLQKRSPYVQHPNTWSTPGGALQHGESPEKGAVREAGEEGMHLP
jgi:NUDIX domain-containing protein/rifampin ADP-ribosyltransferase